MTKAGRGGIDRVLVCVTHALGLVWLVKKVERRLVHQWPQLRPHLLRLNGFTRRCRPAFIAVVVLASIVLPILKSAEHAAAGTQTATMVPNGDVQTGWSPSTGTTHYTLVDEGTTPNTTDYVHTGVAGTVVTDEYGLQGVSNVASASQIVVSVYAESATNANGGILDTLNINLSVSGTAQTAATCTPAYNAYAWCTATFAGSWTQTNVNAMHVVISNTLNGSGKATAKEDDVNVADVYGTLTYVPSIQTAQNAYRLFNNQDAAQSFQDWEQSTHVAQWSPRWGLTSLVYNNKMWIMGGSDQNDVWSSSDGATWTEVTAAAPWAGRARFVSLVYNNKMWIMGGYGKTDVWSSSDGVTWTEATAAAPWPAREDLTGLVYNSKMWIMGGSNGSSAYNDVWSSSDGVTWTEATAAAPWPARYGLTSMVYNNKMWIMGGADFTPTYYNDVWSSSDGITWTESTTGAQWVTRYRFTSLVYNSKMWIMGGVTVVKVKGTPSAVEANDVWSSSDGVTWTQATSAAAWKVRDDFTSLVYNNKMWIMSGHNATNDVWSSSDGVTWTESTTGAPWAVRDDFVSLSYNNKMWIMGGDTTGGSNYLNDVWSSSDGVTWTEATAAAPWPARGGPVGLVYNNKMWIMGGLSGSGSLNDVWSSSDGVTWTEATAAAPWPARYSLTSMVYNNKMWIMAGISSSTHLNDVWSSSDGVTWTEATAAAPWPARVGPTGLVYNNKMWIMGGQSSGGSNFNDVWSSSDGVTWTEATAAAPWAGRLRFTSLVYNNKMWIMAGASGSSLSNDVWSSSDGVTWTEATAAAPWAGRYGLTSMVYNNKMWIMGGLLSDSITFLNDIWSYAPGSIDVGSPLANQNTPTTVAGDGQLFRLRVDLGRTGAQLAAGAGSFKLQYAPMVTSCDTTTSGYSDVTDTSTVQYGANPHGVNGESPTPNVNDPTDGTNTLVYETYQQQGTTTFTNPNAIPPGEDGVWDFALTTYHSLAGKHYCLRIVNGDGSTLGSYATGATAEIVLPAGAAAQANYRWFQNQNATDVGLPLATLGSIADITGVRAGQASQPFRLRLLLGISGSGVDVSTLSLKLQYAPQSGGNCGATPTANFADVSSSTPIHFYTGNTNATDGQALTQNANDPTDGTNPIIYQTYKSTNPFSNSQGAIYAGQDGLWDFPLAFSAGSSHTTWCLRVVQSSTGNAIDAYNVYPQINSAATMDQLMRDGEWWGSNENRQPLSLGQ